VAGVDGMAANTHGMMRAPDGILWFNVSGAAGPDGKRLTDGLGRVDPKTGKMNVFTPATGMAPVIGHVDVDGKGFVWGATTVGAVRLDPKTGEFREFKSLTTDRLALYGVAGDRMGNGWWAEISIDKVGHSDIATGKSLEFDVPPNRYVSQGDLTEEDRKVYEENGIQSAPWAQGPRRLSADKNGDDIWVGLYAGNNLMRLNSRNLEHRIYPAPAGDFGLYMPVVDSNHNVWVDLQGSDAVERFDVKTEKWTRYDWPSRGAAPRHLSLIERDGVTQIVTAFWGTSRVGRMVIRTEKDLQALKAQVQNLTRSMARAQ